MEMKVFGHPYLSMVFQFSTVLSSDQPKWFSGLQGRNQLFISGGGAILKKFHSMTSSCLLNRGTTFSQTVTDKSSIRNNSENENFSVLIKMQTEPSGQSKNQ